jgi:hypothetical protein
MSNVISVITPVHAPVAVYLRAAYDSLKDQQAAHVDETGRRARATVIEARALAILGVSCDEI